MLSSLLLLLISLSLLRLFLFEFWIIVGRILDFWVLLEFMLFRDSCGTGVRETMGVVFEDFEHRFFDFRSNETKLIVVKMMEMDPIVDM